MHTDALPAGCASGQRRYSAALGDLASASRMEPAVWGFLGTLLGAVVGAFASIVTIVVTARNARALQADADASERVERARAFQRDNLLVLQEALAVEMRLVARGHLEDLASYREGKLFPGQARLSEDLDYELLEAARRVAALTERVANNGLRSTIKSLRREMTGVLLARDATESEARMRDISSHYHAVIEQLGTVLRETY